MADIILTEDMVRRFWAKTRPNPLTGCIEWQARLTTRGYGHVNIGGRTYLAHRVAWVISEGQIPGGLCVLHHCDNPICVNAAGGHLFLGTQADNIADRVAKGRSRPSGVVGERHGNAKLSNASVLLIRECAARGEEQRDIGLRFGVAQSTVSLIVRRKAWKHVTSP